jgi:ParB family chromosome partitioning protein
MDSSSSLGKGLESLIPKKNPPPQDAEDKMGSKSAPAQDPSAQTIPSSASVNGGIVDEPEKMLEADEPVMLFTHDDKELLAGEDMRLLASEPLPELLAANREEALQEKHAGQIYETRKENKSAPADGPGWLPAQGDATASPSASGAKQSRVPLMKNINKPYEAVFHIEVTKIKPNPHQPRRLFDAESLKELGHSIQEFGILQPLVVTKREIEVATGTEVEYELIAGERRLEAAKLIGLERVPAIIKSYDLERERLEMAIVENLQRENLSPIEMARAFSRLQDEFRLTQREIATRLGKSREGVANTMRLLDLPPYIQEAVDRKQITESHGRLLLSIDDPAAQERLFHDLQERKMTTREFKRRVDTSREKTHTANEEIDPALEALQARLSSELGAPVRISGGGDTGKITISFYSKEELDSILNKLNAGE